MIFNKPTSVDYKTRRCNQDARIAKKNFFTNKLFFMINTIQLAHRDKIQSLHLNYLAFVKSVGKVQEFLSNLKGRHPNIKLAVEYPNHNHLPFIKCNVTI